MSFRIEPATLATIDQFTGMIRVVAQDLTDSNRALWDVAPLTTANLVADAAVDEYHLAYWNDQLTGGCMLKWHDPFYWPAVPAGQSGFVHKFCVVPAWRKLGVGSQMMAYAESLCRQRGLSELRLDCASDRARLRQYYERHGFVLQEVRPMGRLAEAFYLKRLGGA